MPESFFVGFIRIVCDETADVARFSSAGHTPAITEGTSEEPAEPRLRGR